MHACGCGRLHVGCRAKVGWGVVSSEPLSTKVFGCIGRGGVWAVEWYWKDLGLDVGHERSVARNDDEIQFVYLRGCIKKQPSNTTH